MPLWLFLFSRHLYPSTFANDLLSYHDLACDFSSLAAEVISHTETEKCISVQMQCS
jgi:hypothetical protein